MSNQLLALLKEVKGSFVLVRVRACAGPCLSLSPFNFEIDVQGDLCLRNININANIRSNAQIS